MCTDQHNQLCIGFAYAQIEAGADIITISDDGSGDHVSSNGYKYFSMDANNSLQNALAGKAYTIYHLSSVITEKLPFILSGNFNALSFDARNDIKYIANMSSGSIRLIGCINNLMTLLNGTPREVMSDVLYCIENGMDMISPECAIPCRVTNKNLLAIYNTVDQYSKRQNQKR